MSLILDSSIVIDLERKYQPTIEKLMTLRKQYPSSARITFVTAFEINLGLLKKSIKNRNKGIEFLNKFPVLQTTIKTPLALAELKTKYEEKGVRLPLADLLIATLVKENQGILVTNDQDFNSIEEIKKIIIK